jgi:hypothetical protein
MSPSRCDKGEPGFALGSGTSQRILAQAIPASIDGGQALRVMRVVGADGLEPPTYAL